MDFEVSINGTVSSLSNWMILGRNQTANHSKKWKCFSLFVFIKRCVRISRYFDSFMVIRISQFPIYNSDVIIREWQIPDRTLPCYLQMGLDDVMVLVDGQTSRFGIWTRFRPDTWVPLLFIYTDSHAQILSFLRIRRIYDLLPLYRESKTVPSYEGSSCYASHIFTSARDTRICTTHNKYSDEIATGGSF